MKIIHKVIVVIVLGLFLAGLPSSLPAQTPPKESPKEIVALLKEQSNKLSNDLRRIHREIAALRVDLDKPGIKDIFGGIGYIFGLFGVAAFVASRRKE
jgi:nickel transport protein